MPKLPDLVRGRVAILAPRAEASLIIFEACDDMREPNLVLSPKPCGLLLVFGGFLFCAFLLKKLL